MSLRIVLAALLLWAISALARDLESPAESQSRRKRNPAESQPAELPPIDERTLVIPVEGVSIENVPDTFGDPRSKHSHKAIDIPAPLRTPVLAAEDATVARLVSNTLGGITIYLVEPSETYYYYYAHLNGYAEGLTVGQQVRQGELIGYVGTTGNAPADVPHLHFEINVLRPDKRVTGGTPVNAYPILVKSVLDGSPQPIKTE